VALVWPARQEFLFLAAILDAFSRVIGWGLERHMEAGLCLTALKKPCSSAVSPNR